MITKREVYRYNGNDYESLRDCKKQVESDLGKFIDKIYIGFGPEEKMAIFDWLVDNRSDITILLEHFNDIEKF